MHAVSVPLQALNRIGTTISEGPNESKVRTTVSRNGTGLVIEQIRTETYVSIMKTLLVWANPLRKDWYGTQDSVFEKLRIEISDRTLAIDFARVGPNGGWMKTSGKYGVYVASAISPKKVIPEIANLLNNDLILSGDGGVSELNSSTQVRVLNGEVILGQRGDDIISVPAEAFTQLGSTEIIQPARRVGDAYKSFACW